MEEYDRSNEQERMKSRMADLTPEEARRKAKDAVAKSVALGAGALEGYVDNLDPRVVGEAARVAGQTVRRTAEAVKEEMPARTPHTDLETGETRAGSMKERFAESTEAMKEKASIKAGALKQRSKESFSHLKEDMRTHSADEIRERARDSVGRQIARGTGALEGVLEQTDPDLPAKAVHRTGEAVREAASAIREESHKVKRGPSEGSSLDDPGSGGI